MKIRSLLTILLVGVPLLLIVLAGGSYLFRNTLIAQAIESGGEYATGVETTVGAVDLVVGDGSLKVSDFVLANPSGSDRPVFLSLKQAGMKVEVLSLFGDTAQIDGIVLDGLDLELSRTDGTFNYQTILNNLAQLETTSSQDPGKYQIDAISITNVTALIALVPGGGELTRGGVTIEEIEISNLGTQTQTLAGLSAIVVQGVLKGVVQAGTAGLPDQLVAGLNSALNQSARARSLEVRVRGVKTTGSLDKIRGVANDLLKGKLDVKESLKDLGQGLLGGKKK